MMTHSLNNVIEHLPGTRHWKTMSSQVPKVDARRVSLGVPCALTEPAEPRDRVGPVRECGLRRIKWEQRLKPD